MKKMLVLFCMVTLIAGVIRADVTRQTKGQVSIKGFGAMTSTVSERLAGSKKASDTNSDFKGKGIVGSTLGKSVFRSGQSSEIVDLGTMTITRLDAKKKEYAVSPIEKLKTEEEPAGEKPAKEEASDIKIVRTEFKVDKTGEAKDINAFPCVKYVVTWLVEWENVKTGEKGTEQLLTDVWTTPHTAELKGAMDEEMAFSKQYLAAIGIDADALSRDVLGLEWIGMLGMVNPGRRGATLDAKNVPVAQEMKKLEGFPIVTDGRYTSVRTGGPQEAPKDESSGGGGLGGALGRLAVKGLKKDKKPADPNEPLLSFSTEVLSLSREAVPAAAFQVPADFKKKG